jgi:ArsR family transcriptional regulator, arsenate/arsenite/antimonite-responsive transcriptional repressor
VLETLNASLEVVELGLVAPLSFLKCSLLPFSFCLSGDFCQYRVMSTKRRGTRCCAAILRSRLRDGDAEELAAAFKAIADPARLRLLSFIAAQPSAEACVCHLIAPVGLSQPTVSHHLKVLAAAGLLERERRGTWMFYRLVPARVEALRQALALPTEKAVGVKRSA